MPISLQLSTDQDAHIIKNLWPLYQHDVSAFSRDLPNRHGIFAADDGVTTLELHAESLNPWWRDPNALFPYLILAEGRPAGFNLIAARPHFPGVIPADFVVHEFFVLHAYRGTSVAEQAAMQGFDLHRGRWEAVTYPNHPRGIAFWRRVIRRSSEGVYTEREMDNPWGRKVVFRFDNAGKPTSKEMTADG